MAALSYLGSYYIMQSVEISPTTWLGTPLHEAAKDGKLDVVKILHEKGSNPLIQDSQGRIPLQKG